MATEGAVRPVSPLVKDELMLPVTIEHALENVLVICLKYQSQYFRGLLLHASGQSSSYGIGFQQLLLNNHNSLGGSEQLTADSQLPKKCLVEDVSAVPGEISSTVLRHTSALKEPESRIDLRCLPRELVRPSSPSVCSKNVRDMRLRPRRILCANCSKSVNETDTKSEPKGVDSELDSKRNNQPRNSPTETALKKRRLNECMKKLKVPKLVLNRVDDNEWYSESLSRRGRVQQSTTISQNVKQSQVLYDGPSKSLLPCARSRLTLHIKADKNNYYSSISDKIRRKAKKNKHKRKKEHHRAAISLTIKQSLDSEPTIIHDSDSCLSSASLKSKTSENSHSSSLKENSQPCLDVSMEESSSRSVEIHACLSPSSEPESFSFKTLNQDSDGGGSMNAAKKDDEVKTACDDDDAHLNYVDDEEDCDTISQDSDYGTGDMAARLSLNRYKTVAMMHYLQPDGTSLTVGDVIWGKAKNCKWWPGVIVSMRQSIRRLDGVARPQRAYINWLAWSKPSPDMACADLYPYLTYRSKFLDKRTLKRRGSYKKAIQEADRRQENRNEQSQIRD